MSRTAALVLLGLLVVAGGLGGYAWLDRPGAVGFLSRGTSATAIENTPSETESSPVAPSGSAETGAGSDTPEAPREVAAAPETPPAQPDPTPEPESRRASVESGEAETETLEAASKQIALVPREAIKTTPEPAPAPTTVPTASPTPPSESAMPGSAMPENAVSETTTPETAASQPEPGPSADPVQQAAVTPQAAPSQAERPAPRPPSFDVVRVEPSGEAVLAGRGPPNGRVQIYDGEILLGDTAVNSLGEWVFILATPLTPGSHELGLRAVTITGLAVLSLGVVVVLVPEPPAVAETPETPETPETRGQVASAAPTEVEKAAPTEAPQAPLAILMPREGTAASQILQHPEPKGISDQELVLGAVDYDDSGQVVVSGEAEPGAPVIAYVDNRAIGEARADERGRWEVTPVEPLEPGLHRLRIDRLDPGGQVTARVETPFSRAAELPKDAQQGLIIVQPGNSLWRIARRTYGRGIRYSVIYQANQDQIRDPDLIYPGQIFKLPDDG